MPEASDLTAAFKQQARACATLGSPLYEHLLGCAADEIAGGGWLFDLLRPHAEAAVENALALRLLAPIHRWVLRGELPDLAQHYRSAGGTLPPRGAWSKFAAACADRRVELEQELGLGCQTNEVGRSAPLAIGFLHVAGKTGLPLRLLELGASAGLNLRCDKYWEARWFLALLEAGVRRVPVPAIVERRGCDVNPLDLADENAVQRLRSFVWPDRIDRLAILDSALDLAASIRVEIDRADAAAWLPPQLELSAEGVATIVFHTVLWQYVSAGSRQQIETTLQEAGERASDAAPVAYLRFEPVVPGARFQLRLTSWPGGREELLATADPHGRSVLRMDAPGLGAQE
ncbi:MAG: DUF2332 domain-containing protein [Candidatus Dormibacter sp.]|uniref:DUF2332 domain-containing protein n=1 Tax=Candidatus Dormibacter sp. TaxID=2973982 RepID=UPI003D9AC64E